LCALPIFIRMAALLLCHRILTFCEVFKLNDRSD
jgi:hypothetical protein